MLCLQRKLGESIIIDDNITIQVVGLRHHTVRLGITAPDTITVHREEIYNRILLDRGARVTAALERLVPNPPLGPGPPPT